jgi:hypothetical protein
MLLSGCERSNKEGWRRRPRRALSSVSCLKRIAWDEEEKRFFVFNLIDNTDQVLTEEQLMDRGYTNIKSAIIMGALYRDD